MSVQKQLLAALKNLGSAFEPDELAYLTATSKVEGPVRDRLAWALRKRLGDSFLVAREWKRADLAVLTADGRPAAQVEAKVLCTFNALRDSDTERYIRYLEEDARKMAERAAAAGGDPENYLLSIVFDVQGKVPDHLQGVVKYARDINRYAAAHPGEGGRAQAAKSWKAALDKEFGGTTHVQELDAGTVWDLGVSLNCFLTGPLGAP